MGPNTTLWVVEQGGFLAMRHSVPGSAVAQCEP